MPYRTEADLLAAARSSEADEGDHLDLKRELPPGDRGSKAIAKDLAAMALGGGVILVGVDEGPPVTLSPIVLAGQRERVERIARDGVDPPVVCNVAVMRRDAPDQASGYLVITVPVSDDAPHAVGYVFYGRFGTTNDPLRHREVRRLFEAGAAEEMAGGVRSRVPGLTIDQALDEWVEQDPTPDDQRLQAHVFVVARPVAARPEMLQDVVGTTWEEWTRRTIVDGRARLDREWSPDVGSLSQFERVPDGWRATSDHGPWQTMTQMRETHWLDIEFREDGTVRVFCARGSDHYQDSRVIFELIIGGTVRRTIEAAIVLADTTGYEDRWEIGVAVTNLAGGVSYFRRANWWVDAGDLPPYRESTYRRTCSGTTADLRQDPDAVVERLVGPLNRTLNGGRFQLPGTPRPPAPDDDEDAAAD
jgi:hypothetical protein